MSKESAKSDKHFSLARIIQQLAKLWVRLLFVIAGIAFAGVVSVLLGFNAIPNEVPVVAFVKAHTVESFVIGALLIAITSGSVFLQMESPLPEDLTSSPINQRWYSSRLVLSTTISTISVSMSILLVATVLVRPSWCPQEICPVPAPVIMRSGVHDANLELYFITTVANTFEFDGAPDQYTIATLPRDVPAVQINDPMDGSYEVVIGVHSLQRGSFGIIIERVDLLVESMPAIPFPLTVWSTSTSLTYTQDLYKGVYSGQRAGDRIQELYDIVPTGHTQLAPGEADSLDLQLVSHVPVSLRYRVQVSYRVANETSVHRLVLPMIFQVVFSDSSNWHPYVFSDGHLTSSGR